jgi:tyrosine-specific transport protein
MTKIGRCFGGILLVSGTTIGAGMLGLPASAATSGFYPSLFLFFLVWLLMLGSAYCFLDVNLAVKGETNMISMAGRTLGLGGKSLCWIVYLLLLYSLTAAYIAASTPLFVEVVRALTGFIIPAWLAPFSLPLLFGGFVYLGTRGVDYVNRWLMVGLVLFYLFLVMLLPEHVQKELLERQNWSATFIALPVVMTSFGYHIIIPTLTSYMNHDAKLLRWTLFIGSAIPLVVYIIWQGLILGAVPVNDLSLACKEGKTIVAPLSALTGSPWVGIGARFFSFFAIVTSFLGVALSLADFLTDGFKIKRSTKGRLLACAITFVPPLFFVFAYQKGFYVALSYAGAFVAILLGLLPAMMAWRLTGATFYRTFWGRLFLSAIAGCSLAVVLYDLF